MLVEQRSRQRPCTLPLVERQEIDRRNAVRFQPCRERLVLSACRMLLEWQHAGEKRKYENHAASVEFALQLKQLCPEGLPGPPIRHDLLLLGGRDTRRPSERSAQESGAVGNNQSRQV